MKVLCNH